MKACIVVGTFVSPGQTFVNRHIQHLFDGNTCVLTDHVKGLDTAPHFKDKTYHQRKIRPRPLFDKAIAPFALAQMQLRDGTGRGSWGVERQRVLGFLAREKPDVILSEFGPQSVVMAPMAQAAGIPMFGYFRGSDASSRIRHKHVQNAYKKMMPRLAGVFSVSQFLLDNLAAVGMRHPNAHVIPSGVDVRRFAPSAKRAGSCLALGRFVEKKQPLVTIKAFAEALKTTPTAHLTMIGDGELYEPAKALVAELGIEAQVHLPGALPHEDVRKALCETDVFLQHSITANNGNTEGLPTAIQEAMAAGCVTVSTRHAGIPEAIDEGVTGYLVDEHDHAGYSREVTRALVMSGDEKRIMGSNARAIAVERFDNDVLLKTLEREILRSIGR